MSPPYKYFAFISYSRKDSKAAAWLQKRLEWFRFPVKLVPDERRPPHNRYVRPVYRDKTNLEVTNEHYWTNIRRALVKSRYLVVLCSPHSAASEPVNMEVTHFLETHGDDSSLLVPVIVSGDVTSAGADAALCPALHALGDSLINRNLPTMVPDAVTAEQDAWEQGFVSLVSYLLRLERTALGDHIQRETQRQKRVLQRWLVAVTVLTLAAAVSAFLAIKAQQRAKTSEQAAQAAKDKAVASRKAADELISYMQYDLRDTLGKLGSLKMMDGINERIRRYHEQHPPEAGDAAVVDAAARERSVALDQRGNLQLAQGDLAAALQSYRESLAIRQKLAAKDSDNTLWQRDLALSFNKVGKVQVAQGDLAAALQSYRDSLTIMRKLSAKDPDNTDWQRDLSTSFNKVGSVQEAQGNLTAALQSFRDSLAIAQKLAAKDPDNTHWQRDLSISFNRVGKVQQAQGDLAAALESYRDCLAIAQKLAAKDLNNTHWQRDLSISFEKVGDIAQQQQRWGEAGESYAREVALARPWLARKDADVRWLSLFAYGVGRCWEVLRDAPAGTVKIDRAAALTDLRTARDAMQKLKDAGRFVPPMDKNLPWIEGLVAAAEAASATPAKQ